MGVVVTVEANTNTAYRDRALIILQNKYGNDKPLEIDYLIDDECRKVLELPDRPLGDKPYVGWMVGNEPKDAKSRKTSSRGIELIKRWEGLRTNAYLCPGNVWTIGYGHTTNVHPGMMISHAQAEILLRQDLVRFERAVERYVTVPINQNQFDALVSFAFNVGTEALRTSSLVRILNKGKYKTAALQFGKWVFAAGRKLPGLVSRRNDEYQLFIKE